MEEASESSESQSDEQSEAESQEADTGNVTMMSLYELTDDGQSIIAKSFPKLPIFNAKLNDIQMVKVITDTGAITVIIYQREN
jgi:hypothetical protein